MHITGRRKGGYLTGAVERPEESDPKYQVWNENDNLVRSWLINSMNSNIGENFLLHQTAQEIWEDARDTYSTTDNSSALFEVETQLYNLKQGEMDASEYFNTLGRYWLHLDMYEAQPWDTAKDAKLFKRFIEKKRTLQFLLGLNQSLDDAKSRIMGTKPFPSLKEAFAEVRREESRRKLMLSSQKVPGESSALAVQSKPRSDRNQSKGKEHLPTCEHCHKVGHTKEECWELVGKPADWKPRYARRGRAHTAATGSEKQDEGAGSSPFSKEQYTALQQMLSQIVNSGHPPQKSPEAYTGFFTNKGGNHREDDWQH
ncbi:hypothetical protein LINPERHAP1_LOCUS28873 [Linum perenne]